VINRAGIGNRDVYDYAHSEKIEILAEIPEDRRVAQRYSRGEILVDKDDSFQLLFDKLANKLKSF
jgi:MinD superfamily P-loop ATPase